MTSLTDEAASDLFRAEPDRWIDVGAGEAALRTVGTGPDVLFVHGWPVSGATFRKLLPHLVDHVTCHVIDFPSAGSSRFDDSTPMSIDQHVETVRQVVDALDVDEVAVVGHDSGGMIARHAMAGHPRLRAMGLINTEPAKPSWRFTSFTAAGGAPGLAKGLRFIAARPAIHRRKFVFGDAFVDRSLLEGEFEEFFLAPLSASPERCSAAAKLLKSLDMKKHVNALADLHSKVDVPVQLVWGAKDPFFPVARARSMVDEFPNARLTELPGVGLFSHEEAPEAVAAALLPALTGTWT